ncbi:hypothetical protein [Tsukamurella tyrosinosolvens]|uniref:hypothetical protein n=1 Tax=Tsukamurella tyrosinosolvens TaxID=57704 RepID=UPI002DD44BBF|nr:hypothetical protein [Tsukamurella tyrosinosolvens]MEC4615882.1 hypothetical protein [Tsukamurella tyrosinosolvens]
MTANAERPSLDTFFAVAVFEIGRSDGSGAYYREDSYLIHAESLTSAKEKFDAIAREQESAGGTGVDRSYVRLARLVDLAPTLYSVDSRGVTDLYSRHFASLADYAAFEMKFGASDPFLDDVIPATSQSAGTTKVRVSTVRWHWDGNPGWVEVEVADADSRTHRISEKVPVLTALDLYPDTPVSDLPTELWIDVDLVQAADKRVTISLRHGVETVDGLSVLTVPTTAVRQNNVGTDFGEN